MIIHFNLHHLSFYKHGTMFLIHVFSDILTCHSTKNRSQDCCRKDELCRNTSDDCTLICFTILENQNGKENSCRLKTCVTFERGNGGLECTSEGSTSSEIRGILPSCFLWVREDGGVGRERERRVGERLWLALSWVSRLCNKNTGKCM